MKHNAFTLSELLIALLILGVIATFTIPKVLSSQQDSRFRAIAKEAAGAVSQAFETYKLQNQVAVSTSFSDLTPYLNYVKFDTSTATFDLYQGALTRQCGENGDLFCLHLHNGAILQYDSNEMFCNMTSGVIYFYVDPDGKITGGNSGKSTLFFLSPNGRVRTYGSVESGSQAGDGSPVCSLVYNPTPAADPPWFGWDS